MRSVVRMDPFYFCGDWYKITGTDKSVQDHSACGVHPFELTRPAATRERRERPVRTLARKVKFRIHEKLLKS